MSNFEARRNHLEDVPGTCGEPLYCEDSGRPMPPGDLTEALSAPRAAVGRGHRRHSPAAGAVVRSRRRGRAAPGAAGAAPPKAELSARWHRDLELLGGLLGLLASATPAVADPKLGRATEGAEVNKRGRQQAAPPFWRPSFQICTSHEFRGMPGIPETGGELSGPRRAGEGHSEMRLVAPCRGDPCSPKHVQKDTNSSNVGRCAGQIWPGSAKLGTMLGTRSLGRSRRRAPSYPEPADVDRCLGRNPPI